VIKSFSEVKLYCLNYEIGKTLNMSMLRYFFDIENGKENRKVFDGLKIESTDKMEYQEIYINTMERK
jgi:hypothetical protein